MKIVKSVARPLLSWVFINGGIDVLRRPQGRAELAGPFIDRVRAVAPALPGDRVAVVRINAAVQVAAGAALATGRFPRIAALALAGSLVPTTVGGHAFWTHEDTTARKQHRTHFEKNLAIIAGLLLVAADGGAGRAAPCGIGKLTGRTSTAG